MADLPASAWARGSSGSVQRQPGETRRTPLVATCLTKRIVMSRACIGPVVPALHEVDREAEEEPPDEEGARIDGDAVHVPEHRNDDQNDEARAPGARGAAPRAVGEACGR